MNPPYTLRELRNWKASTTPYLLRLAVIGDPVAHSLSPQMHNAALSALGLPFRYTQLWLRDEELDEALTLLPDAGFLGINVTLPHKPRVLSLVDKVDPHARRMRSVNTVRIQEGELQGFSTDGPGFVRAVGERFERKISDLRVLVLGAGGGAGRAIATQCAIEGCPQLVLVNRTIEKLDSLMTELRGAGRSIPWEAASLEAALQETDLIVNASVLGMKPGDASPIPFASLRREHLVFDTIYSGGRSQLLQDAETIGARGANGLSMLLHQGVLSLEIWLGQEAPIDVMRSALCDATGETQL